MYGRHTTFAVHAPAATRVRLEFFAEPTGQATLRGIDLACGDDGAWRGQFQGVQHGSHYGFRVWGPNWPSVGEWAPGGSDAGFLSDEEVFADGFDDGMFGTGGEDYHGQPRRNFDTARWAPKGIVVILRGPCQEPVRAPVVGAARCSRPPSRHLCGCSPAGPPLEGDGLHHLGTVAGHETNTSRAAHDQGRGNHWGYMTLSFFSPNRAYAHDKSPVGPTRVFKQMVRAFHDAGKEIYLDVVYNHTGEGGNWGDPDTTGFVRHFFDDHPLLVDIEQMAAEREVEVVAEAWDLWGYEVGNFPI